MAGLINVVGLRENDYYNHWNQHLSGLQLIIRHTGDFPLPWDQNLWGHSNSFIDRRISTVMETFGATVTHCLHRKFSAAIESKLLGSFAFFAIIGIMAIIAFVSMACLINMVGLREKDYYNHWNQNLWGLHLLIRHTGDFPIPLGSTPLGRQ